MLTDIAGIPPPAPADFTDWRLAAPLLDGQVDAALSYKPTIAVPIEAVPLASEDFVFVSPRTHAAEARRDAASVAFVTYDEFEYVFARWFGEQSSGQPSRLKVVDHTNELEEAITSVRAGRGCTILPADAWRAVDRPASCEIICHAGKAVTNQIYLLSIAGADQSARRTLASLFGNEPA